jgi:hypothetical protein
MPGLDPVNLRPLISLDRSRPIANAGNAACDEPPWRRAPLPERQVGILFTQINRLDRQKGWDLPAEVADDVLRSDHFNDRSGNVAALATPMGSILTGDFLR